MKTAIISDIHGNLIALDAVMQALQREGYDQLVCLGDVALMGAQPGAALNRIRELNCPVIMGNTDFAILDLEEPDADEPERHKIVYDVAAWGVSQLDEEQRDFVSGFAPSLDVEIGSGRLMQCYHGTPQSWDVLLTVSTPEDELAEYAKASNAMIFAGGHTHVQMFRRFQKRLFINPGSVGLSFENLPDGTNRNPGYAEYAMLTSDAAHLDVSLRQVEYDRAAVVQAIRAAGMPHEDWLLRGWLM